MVASMRSRTEIIGHISEFIKSNRGISVGIVETIDPDSDLYELGILDSYDLIDLISTLEELTGKNYGSTLDTDDEAIIFSINFLTSFFSELPQSSSE